MSQSIQNLAMDRMLTAIRIIRAPLLTSRVKFEIAPGLGTACWSKKPGQTRAVIRVDQQLAEHLQLHELAALLLHELMHHVGCNHQMLNPKGKNPLLVNLALDIILERMLSRQPRLRSRLIRLNQFLLEKTYITPKSPLHEAMVFLVHAEPPFEQMPRGFKSRHQQIWGKRSIRFTAEDVYALLASIRGATSLTEFPFESPFRCRYQPENRIVPHDEISSRLGIGDGSPILPPHPDHDDNLESCFTHWVDYFQIEAISMKDSETFAANRRALGWLNREVKFDPRVVLNELIGEQASYEIDYQPFLTNPTPAAIANFLSGHPQLYFENIKQSSPTLSVIYFDVSGSMSGYYTKMVDFARILMAYRPARVFSFDTEIRRLALENLAAGKIESNGSTRINAVLEDVLRIRPRQFFIVTDNCDTVDPNLFAQIKKSGIESRGLIFGKSNTIDWDRCYYWK